MVFLQKLSAVMFYASIPLILPMVYSLLVNDGAAVPILIPIIILAFPAFPHIMLHILKNIKSAAIYLLNPETPWNYASVIHIKEIEKHIETLTMGEVLALTSLVWLIVPIIGAVPYLFYGFSPVNALFESMSGWTSTGLSAVSSVAQLPKSIIFFRSMTQWIGGLGIIILMLTVMKGRESYSFLHAEGHSSSEVGIGKTVSLIWKIYITLTILGIGMLIFLSMDIFNAVNLAMSGISNGGFFPFDSYDLTSAQNFALAALMFGGATCFLFYKQIAGFKLTKAFLDEEFIFYVIITIVAILLISFIGNQELSNAILNAVSAVACGGFAIGDLSVMHRFSIYILILLMISGGMVGSTTGGIKLRRMIVVFKAVWLRIKAAFLPSGSVQVVKLNGIAVMDSLIVQSSIFIFSYIALLLFASGVFIAIGYGIENSLFTVASALGNVGLATTSIHSMGDSSKLFLTFIMYLGRIEIFPSLALANYIIRIVRR